MSATELITPNQWEAFDEFVNLIGAEDRYRLPASGSWRTSTDADLIRAGLLDLKRGSYPYQYGLTPDGRREACSRNGHEFNPNRPATDGCAMCDAVICSNCEGFGKITCPPNYESDCANCNGAGIVERLTA